MPFIYITGCAGSGKSTIQKELLILGYDAHDEDDPDIGSAYNKQSNKAVKVPTAEKRTPKWFSEHEWRLLPEALHELKQLSTQKLVFLCGSAVPEDQAKDLFDKVVFLDIDDQTLRKRILSREGNDYGKTGAELQMILETSKTLKKVYEKNGSIIIDASWPQELVLANVLQTIRG